MIENKKPLLSICIPTYNRELYLKRLLDSIVCQKEFTDTDEVEIVIDDGPSKDNTKTLVQEYQKQYPNKIRYYRNDVAIGMCPAFLEAIEYSGGEYTWLFGSDDVMSYDALEKTLFIIKNEQPTLIISDRKEIANENDMIISDSSLKALSFNGCSQFTDYLGSNYEQTRHQKNHYFTYISIFCFNTEFFTKSFSYIKEYNLFNINDLKYNYFNWAIILYSQLFSNKIVLIQNNIVFTQVNNHGRHHTLKIPNDLEIMLGYIKKNYSISSNCHKLFTKIFRMRYMAGLLGSREKNKFLNFAYYGLSFLWRKISNASR